MLNSQKTHFALEQITGMSAKLLIVQPYQYLSIVQDYIYSVLFSFIAFIDLAHSLLIKTKSLKWTQDNPQTFMIKYRLLMSLSSIHVFSGFKKLAVSPLRERY